MQRKSMVAGMALMFASTLAAHQGAHEHGLADLRIAVDGTTVLIEFESPLDNLVGFEHAPRTTAQHDALAAMERRLKRFDGLFGPTDAAACVLADVQIESPYPRTDPHAHDHDGHGDDPDHDHAHDHGEKTRHEHAHASAHDHADLYVVYQLECANPDALTAIDVGLFDAFPRLRSVRVESATPAGQRAARLDKANPRLPL